MQPGYASYQVGCPKLDMVVAETIQGRKVEKVGGGRKNVPLMREAVVQNTGEPRTHANYAKGNTGRARRDVEEEGGLWGKREEEDEEEDGQAGEHAERRRKELAGWVGGCGSVAKVR